MGKNIYRIDPDGESDYDGEESVNEEYEEMIEELRLISDSYSW